jgi:hypothetical protein
MEAPNSTDGWEGDGNYGRVDDVHEISRDDEDEDQIDVRDRPCSTDRGAFQFLNTLP